MYTNYTDFVINEHLKKIENKINLLCERRDPDERSKEVIWDIEPKPLEDEKAREVTWDIEPEEKKIKPIEDVAAKEVVWDIENNKKDIHEIKDSIVKMTSSIKDKVKAEDTYKVIIDKISKSNKRLRAALLTTIVIAFASFLTPTEMTDKIENKEFKSEVSATIEKNKVQIQEVQEIHPVKIERVPETEIQTSSLPETEVKSSEEINNIKLVNDFRSESYLEMLKQNDPIRYEYAAMTQDAQTNLAKNLLRNESDFLKKLSSRESSDRPWKRNDGMYIGLFQIGKYSMTELNRGKSGLKLMKDGNGKIYTKQGEKEESLQKIDLSFDRTSFESHPEKLMPDEQITCMKYLIDRNIYYLRSITTKSGGKYRLKRKYRKLIIGGKSTEVSISGMIAASHLIGASDLITYIKGGAKLADMPYDGNMKSADYYMRYFDNLSMD